MKLATMGIRIWWISTPSAEMAVHIRIFLTRGPQNFTSSDFKKLANSGVSLEILSMVQACSLNHLLMPWFNLQD
jgi:hypothetical protein